MFFSTIGAYVIYDKKSVLFPMGYSLASRLRGCVTSSVNLVETMMSIKPYKMSHKKSITRFLP